MITMAYEYWTKSPGASGALRENEDFVVREIIDPKFLIKFSRDASGVKPVKGPYTLFLLEKNGLGTIDALKIIAKQFSIRVADIGYAGLKDKNAITFQYVTIKGIEKEINKDNLKLTKVGYSKNMICVGDLIGNKFEITLHDCKNIQNLEKIISEIKERGLPNHFGPQRFGINEDNHKIGKMIVKRRLEHALSLINKNHSKHYDDIRKVPKKMLKFFIHAYQSWIFNEALSEYIKNSKKPACDNIPIIGYGSKPAAKHFDMILKNILKKEGISADNFRLSELMICCNGGKRKAFISVSDISYDIKDNDVKICFALPKGSYATVLINEINKL
jgi:tRNA pseudouridine13 synthase